jgi:cell division protein FtsB
MTELFDSLISYVAIWAPSLAAMLGIAATVFLALSKMTNTINSIKADKTLADVYTKMDKLTNQNAELTRCNKLLLEQLTKIQNYADEKAKEE